MKKQVVQKEIYVTEDGREFDDVSKAERHEEKSTALSDIKQYKPIDDVYHTVYIPSTVSESCLKAINSIERIFRVKNKINSGWNLIHDKGEEASSFPIDDLVKQYSTPTPRSMELPNEGVKVASLKKSIMDIVTRNSRLQATPQAILGNLIMELQDLVR